MGKGSAKNALAITNIRLVRNEKSTLGADFAPCGDGTTVVFNLPGGRVVYLGHLSHSIAEGGVRVSYKQEQNLRQFGMKEHFNVGHFGVRPDYFDLARVPMSDVVCYLRKLIYEATGTLEKRRHAESGCTADKPLQPIARDPRR